MSISSADRRSLFTGLSAFPLTPLRDDAIDEPAFTGLIARLAAAGVLLAPMSYQPLTDDDVAGLFRAVTEHTDLPVVVYDNPGTTHFTFSDELYGRIGHLPGIASLKIPPLAGSAAQARDRVASLRAMLPEHITIGVSGDASAAAGLLAGCDAWYSVLAGTLPEPALEITRAALEGRADDAVSASQRLSPIWELFAEFGSLRVTAAIAEHLGLAPRGCLPLPLRGLDDEQRARTAEAVERLGLG